MLGSKQVLRYVLVLVILMRLLLAGAVVPMTQSFASGQAFVPGPIQVHSLSQIVAQTTDNGRGETGSSYFGALSRPTLPGPLVGGSVSNKELNKWLDDQAANCLSEEPNFRNSGSLPMLWGLLKLACKHYGKLRSQAGLAGITSQV